MQFLSALALLPLAFAAPNETICGQPCRAVIPGNVNQCFKIPHIPIPPSPEWSYPCFTGFIDTTPAVGSNEETQCDVQVMDQGSVYTRYRLIDQANKKVYALIFRRL